VKYGIPNRGCNRQRRWLARADRRLIRAADQRNGHFGWAFAESQDRVAGPVEGQYFFRAEAYLFLQGAAERLKAATGETARDGKGSHVVAWEILKHFELLI
jgi:hypothetical protein